MNPETMTESETCELKKSLSELKEGLVSIAAILNKHGEGDLWFGIKNDGQPVGLDINEKTLRDVSQAIAAHVEPKIYPKVTAESVCGAACIHIAFSGKENPYFAYGRAYMRVADEDRQMSAKALEKLILSKNRDALRFDNQPTALRLRDLDVKRIKLFVSQAGLSWGNEGAQHVLEKLAVFKDGAVLQSAALFFAKAPPAQLRCALFAGTTSATILDQHDFEGTILDLIEEAQKYILKNIRIGMRLNGLRREDVPEIAPEALREAVINAFCHRDWRDPESVRVAIYTNRVEIRNPGSLPEGLTVERMRQGHISRRRNPLVADLLRRVHLVEAWGRGMPLILEKAPHVEFEDVAGIFIARFARPRDVAQETAIQTHVASGESSVKSSGKGSGKTGDRILALIATNPEITIPELSGHLEITTRAVEKQVAKLQLEKRLRRIGPDKGGRWEVLP